MTNYLASCTGMIRHDVIFITGAISFTAYQFTPTKKVLWSWTVLCIHRVRALARKTSRSQNIYFKPKKARNVKLLPLGTILSSLLMLPTNYVKSSPLSHSFFYFALTAFCHAPTLRVSSLQQSYFSFVSQVLLQPEISHSFTVRC